MQHGSEVEQTKADLEVANQQLQKRVEELEQAKTRLESKVDALEQENEQLQKIIFNLQGGQTVQLTHRNILYSEDKDKKRLPVFKEPVRGAQKVASLVFGECFAVRDRKEEGQDLWLQIRGGDYAELWVLARDAGTVNCADMTQYTCAKYCTRIQSSEFSGQDFPKKMYTEGFAGSNNNSICLISASGDSFWREVNIEMLLRGIATATVFEEAWGGDGTFTDWVAYYAVNCVQYGQLRTHHQKRLLVTVKPTGRWRDYQVGCCCGPDLDKLRDDIGKAQYKECFWLKGMREQLHVRWEEVEFLTGFAFLRAHCAWTLDDCRRAANERFVWVLDNFFAGGHNDKAAYELERAHWLWDEAFDGCMFDKDARATAYTELQRAGGARLEIPRSWRTAGPVPLAWVELAAEASAVARRFAAEDRLAAGAWHSASLDFAGTLCVWGENKYGQCSVPTLAPGESWAAVSAGESHTLGLTTAGVLHAWGNSGQSFRDTMALVAAVVLVGSGQCSVPALAQGERWVAMSAGGVHSLGLTSAGALHAWGSNREGQCAVPVLPSGERWAAASAGDVHSLGVTVAGRLYAWGSDSNGRCSRAPVLPQGHCWTAVSAGALHSLGLTAAGELHAWGENLKGRCRVPALPPSERWVAISAGGHHSLGLTSTDALHAWGDDEQGQCKVPVGERWIAASAGGAHSLGLTSAGVVRAWGWNGEGQVSHTS